MPVIRKRGSSIDNLFAVVNFTLIINLFDAEFLY